jgi:hypothetical protein
MTATGMTPEERMAALFDGLSRIERIALLGRLEKAGRAALPCAGRRREECEGAQSVS